MRKEVGFTDEALWKLKYENKTTYKELKNLTGLSYGSLQSRIYRWDNAIKKGGVPSRPELFGEDFGTPLELDGDFVIVSDVHVPTTDYDFAQLPALVAKKKLKRGNRRLIIDGDLFNMDAFSGYDALTKRSAWKHEKEAAKQLIAEWLRMFDEITFVMGNHERRIQKWTGGELDVEEIHDMLGGSNRVKVSNFGYCFVNSGGVKWLVAHPKNYSINQLSALDPIAHKYQCNVVAGHDHHLAHGWDRYKHYQVASLGCLAQDNGFGYTQIDVSKSANFTKGFGLLKDGFLQIYGDDRFTNWSEVI